MIASERRWSGTLLLLGTIIGAGIFGVPAMIGAWGVLPATFAFAVLTLIVLGTHLLYAEALLLEKTNKRMPGQAAYWLGKPMGTLTGFAFVLQTCGSNLAYIILGGEFLAVLARILHLPGSVLIWQVIFWAAGAITVLVGLSFVERVEGFLTWALVAVIFALTAFFLMRLDFSAILSMPSRFTFEPYGVFLFSLLGTTSMPEVEDIVRSNKRDMRLAVLRGTLGAAVLTYIFGVTAWLASGASLSRDPADLVLLLPPAVAFIIPLFGFLAVGTSFLTMSLDLRNMFHIDYHFTAPSAWLAALGVPFALLFLTTRDFLATIGLVGATFSAFIAATAALTGRAALRRRKGIEKFSTLWWQANVFPALIVLAYLVGGLAWLTYA
ncbi:hypothetical protein KJZ71_00040 [Patescibacteria group bacterium]|nr:hypothetical protein [Patescibacteria group bacterium]